MVSREVVARAARVSPYTVSVVLNDAAYGRVSPAVRERVRQVADALGYRPQAAGRALRLGRTELIAYLASPQLLHEVTSYHGALVPALLSTANEAGFDVAILGDDSPAQLLTRLRRAVQAGRYDGVIVGRPRVDDPVIDLLRRGATPFVLAGSYPDASLYQVRRDDAGVAADAARRLIAHGHRWMGFASEGQNVAEYHYARVRRDTVGHLAGQAGGQVIDLPHTPAAAVALCRQQGVTAIIAERDSIAVRFIDAAGAAGLRVPHDLSVVSLYGVRQPAPSDPSLAAVCVDPSDAGTEAVRLLSALVAGRPPPEREVVLPSWFVAGVSLGPAPAAE
jgi:LacI family transcriptional regulator